MADGIFREGFLEMSTSPLEQVGTAGLWGDCIPNRILAVLSILLFFLIFADYLRMVPTLLDCFGRYRANMTLEHSVSKARSRNFIAAFSILPFGLLIDRAAIFRPSFWRFIPEGWSVFVTLGFVCAYFLLRSILYLLTRPKGFNSEELAAVRHSIYNYFIILVSVLVLAVLVLSVFKVPAETSGTVLLWVMAVIWAVAFLRIGQFFGAHCNGFSTFLYLCGLEFLPLGILLFISTR